MVNLEYAVALNRLTNGGVTIGWERYSEKGNQFEWPVLNDEERAIFMKPFQPQKIGIIKTTPPHFFHNQSKFRIGYSMVENTMMAKHWVKNCNEMDAMFAPSPFAAEIMRNSGVKVPVHAVKQGVNPKKYPFTPRKLREKFVFGTVGVQDERKNWKDLLVAFCSEFHPNEPVELWIKNTNPQFGNIGFKDERVRIINTFYNFEELKLLYDKFNVFVFPSHAEGSGMPPREAMAMGIPTILTNWSGLAEIANPEYNYPLTPVSIDFPEAPERINEQPGMQARIDVAELMYWMRYTYDNYTEAVEKAEKASQWIMKEFSWDQCAREMLEILKKYQ